MKWRLITCLILAFCIVLPSATVAAEDTDITGTVPLVISGVSDSNITTSSATISWKTNGDATSQVFYDTVYHEDIALYAYLTEDTDLVSEHSVRLTGLSSGRTYHYRVRSAVEIDGTEFEDISEEDDTFRTSSRAPSPPPTYYTVTNLFGIEKSYRIDSDGEILKTIEATSADGNLTMTIPEGTIALDKDGKRLKTLEAAVDETPPDPPEDAHIIGLAYDFGPDGATFDPPITLEYSYDPADIPEGIAEEDLVIAYYDEATGEWVELPCIVDTENNTITALVSHFTTFAIIGTVMPEEEEIVPPPPPPPAPAAFSLTGLSVTPVEVLTGEAVTITVSVANTGGTEGSYTAALKINGVKEAEKSVTIAAGSSEMVTFSVTKKEVGSYTVTVDGLSASFAVVAVEEVEEVEVVPIPTPGVNWPLIGGVIAAVVVVVGLFGFFLLRRRGKQQK